MLLNLPKPSVDALAASNALTKFIINYINSKNRWISFAQYMNLVLYTPGLGYYSGGATKLGKEGDFITGPEISPLFGITLANLIIKLFKQDTISIMEFGVGTGQLAFDILNEISKRGVVLKNYYIMEISAQLRAKQQTLLHNFPQVSWLNNLPESFSGIIICNEVLDAMPVHLVVYNKNRWFERGVTLDTSKNFIYADRPCNSNFCSQIPNKHCITLQGYLTEVHPIAISFIRSLAAILKDEKSLILLIDYGFPAQEYYMLERSQGTLMCHYRHHAHTNPFYLPGLQDITAHIDFTAITRAAINCKLDLLVYTSQAAFLLNAGIGKLLLRTDPCNFKKYLLQSNAVQKLISPAEMGELFKVLAIGKNIDWPDYMMPYDRSHRL